MLRERITHEQIKIVYVRTVKEVVESEEKHIAT